MASLQVEGSMLETSCGSPHYACPEVIRVRMDSIYFVVNNKYRGKSTMDEKPTFGAVVLFSTLFLSYVSSHFSQFKKF